MTSSKKSDKRIRVLIEKLRMKNGNYKILKFSIYIDQQLVYQKDDYQLLN